MIRNLILVFLMLLPFFGKSQSLEEIRSQYPHAEADSDLVEKLDSLFTEESYSGHPELQAYRGAVKTLMAKFAKAPTAKISLFNKGSSLIDEAVQADPSNVEIRYIRMSVQENSPKLLGYNKNLEEDKTHILKGFSKISSQSLKDLIHQFASDSKNFDEEEVAGLK